MVKNLSGVYAADAGSMDLVTIAEIVEEVNVARIANGDNSRSVFDAKLTFSIASTGARLLGRLRYL
jgi:hypothetical protein